MAVRMTLTVHPRLRCCPRGGDEARAGPARASRRTRRHHDNRSRRRPARHRRSHRCRWSPPEATPNPRPKSGRPRCSRRPVPRDRSTRSPATPASWCVTCSARAPAGRVRRGTAGRCACRTENWWRGLLGLVVVGGWMFSATKTGLQPENLSGMIPAEQDLGPDPRSIQ